MLSTQNALRWACVLSGLGLLAGCGSYGKVRDGQTDQPVWPEVGDARPIVAETIRPELDKLRQVKAGMSKTDVYQLIGHPQYREGMAGVHEWNFVFLLPDGRGGETTCQYKILYDDAMLARSFFWKPQACADLVDPPAAPLEPAAQDVNTVDLSTDMLFEFDSARLRPEGTQALDERVISALTDAKRLQRILLTGHADRMGADAYNLRLSQRRADAVKQYLVGKGVPASSIEAIGRGEADPVVSCNDRGRAALIRCLAPNRRVRVEITVDR